VRVECALDKPDDTKVGEPSMKRFLIGFAALAVAGATVLVAPGGASAASYCGITWGSLAKSGGALSTAPLTSVRAGQHDCYDRLVFDIRGAKAGYQVSYVSQVHAQDGSVIPLRGGAFLEIELLDPAYDQTGHVTYNPANPRELVNLAAYRTFRQAAWGGSFEGYTTVGLGVRARLPFRVFTLAGPGSSMRIVLDVAHQW
jgi:hypothetical protein